MKKRLVVLILGVILALSVTACGGEATTSEGTAGKESSVQQEKEASKEKESEETTEEKEAKREAAESWYYIGRSEDREVYYFANANAEVVAIDKLKGALNAKDLEFHYNVTVNNDENYKDVLVDIEGKVITEPGAYDYISRANKELFRVEKEDKWGLINYKGEVVVPLAFDEMTYYEDYGTGFFVGEPTEGGQYVMYNSDGVELLKSSEELSDDSIRLMQPFGLSCGLYIYQDAIYRLSDGSKLSDYTEDVSWCNNMLYKDGKLTAFDEKLQVSDELVVEDFDRFTEYWDEGQVASTKGGKYYTLDDSYRIVEVPRKLGNTEHTLENGKKYKSSLDEAAKTLTISDEAGNVLCTLSTAEVYMPNFVDVCGNYLALMAKKGYFFIDLEKGEFITEGADYAGTDINGVVDVRYGVGANAYHAYFNEDFLLTTNTNCYSQVHQNGFWIIDEEVGVATSYNLKGEPGEEITGISRWFSLADECFMLMLENGKSQIISNTDGKLVWELDYNEEMRSGSFFPYAHIGIGVLELADGFYNLEGKCVLKK